MATVREWALGLARQALCDLDARDVLAAEPSLPECQRLHFLQMACEKLCKAHLYESGSARLGVLETSHAYIAKHLPGILRAQHDREHAKQRGYSAQRAKRFRGLAREIELLAPAVKDGGRRQENCEYPWETTGGRLVVPVDYEFPSLSLLGTDSGREFLKLLRLAANTLVEDLSKTGQQG